MKIFKLLSFVICFGLVACDENKNTIAYVGDEVITQESFDAYLKLKRVPLQNTEKVNAALDTYLGQEAVSVAITETDLLNASEVAAEVNEFRKQLLVNRYLEQYLEDKVSEQAIRNYYATHKDDYAQTKVHVAHVLIRSNASATEVEKAAQLTRAREAHSKILSGVPFEKVALNFSEDKATAKKGGDLGWITEKAIGAKIAKVAFKLQKGDISEPVASSFGIHILKILAEAQKSFQPYEKLKGDIRYQLRQEAKTAEIERLSSKVKVERVGN